MISPLRASIFSPLLTILDENKPKWLSINHLLHKRSFQCQVQSSLIKVNQGILSLHNTHKNIR